MCNVVIPLSKNDHRSMIKCEQMEYDYNNQTMVSVIKKLSKTSYESLLNKIK